MRYQSNTGLAFFIEAAISQILPRLTVQMYNIFNYHKILTRFLSNTSWNDKF